MLTQSSSQGLPLQQNPLWEPAQKAAAPLPHRGAACTSSLSSEGVSGGYSTQHVQQQHQEEIQTLQVAADILSSSTQDFPVTSHSQAESQPDLISLSPMHPPAQLLQGKTGKPSHRNAESTMQAGPQLYISQKSSRVPPAKQRGPAAAAVEYQSNSGAAATMHAMSKGQQERIREAKAAAQQGGGGGRALAQQQQQNRPAWNAGPAAQLPPRGRKPSLQPHHFSAVLPQQYATQA